MKITEEVVNRVEEILKITNTKMSSSPKVEEDNISWCSRFMAYMQASCLIRGNSSGGIFGHPSIVDYCLTGKLPKECFEELIEK